jgi:ubiquinone/menaquinone biosynthesis C-methylase UbiE
MNYDATNLAANYDLGRDHGPEFLDLWMRTVSSYLEGQTVKTILDLGCGTGRFSEGLARHFNAEVAAVDPSTKMLEQARRKQTDIRVKYQSGSGESLSLADKSVDLVFTSMAFHHFEDPALVARQCRRVLRDGATVFLRAASLEQIPDYPYVDFFPAAVSILEQRLPSVNFMKQIFEAAGFRTVAEEIIPQQIAPNLESYADKLATKSDSVLSSLSESDFEAGLKALRSYAASVEPQPVFEKIDIFVFR